jgi:hypothetical protein
MADVNFAVTSFTLATSGSTQDVTISGFGTPKAAMFFWSDGQTDDTVSTENFLGFGFTDGVRQWSAVCLDFSIVVSTRAGRRHSDDHCVMFVADGGGASARYGFNSWITDGFRLDVDSPLSNGRLVTAVLINGDDVTSAYVNYKDDLGTSTSAVDISDPGFEPDLVFLSCIGESGTPPSGAVHFINTFGACINDGSATQRIVGYSSQDGVSTTNITGYIGNTYATGQIFNGSLSWGGQVGAFDSSGFSITPSTSAGSDIVGYLALKFANDPDIALFDMTWPASGSYSETAPGFEPAFGLISSLIGPSSRNTPTDADTCLSVAAFDSSAIFTSNAASRDNVSTSNSAGLHADRLRILQADTTGDAVLASDYAFDSDGWDFTLTTNPSSAVLGWGLAIGAGGAASPGVSPYGKQSLKQSYQPIAASRLNGVMQ